MRYGLWVFRNILQFQTHFTGVASFFYVQLLGELIGPDTIPLSALRPRIIEHLLPSLPIAVDYNLNPVISASGSNPAG